MDMDREDLDSWMLNHNEAIARADVDKRTPCFAVGSGECWMCKHTRWLYQLMGDLTKRCGECTQKAVVLGTRPQ